MNWNHLNLAAILLSISLPQTALAQDWKLNNNFAQTRNETRLLTEYAQRITDASGNQFKVTAYSGGALGLTDADVIRWLPEGAADMGLIISSYLGRDAPALNAAYIQGGVGSYEEHIAALPVLKDIYAEFMQEWDLVPLAYVRVPLWKMSIFCKGEPVNSLEQLRSKKLRVYTRDLIETFSALGIASQIVPQSDMYVALQTGVVDCTVYGNRLAKTVSLQEVTNSFSYLFPSATMPFVVATTKAKWDSLSPEMQQVFREAGEWLEQESVKDEWDAAAEDSAVSELIGAGLTDAGSFSEADLRAFQEAATRTWKALADSSGEDAVTWRSEILAAIAAKK